MYRKFEKEIDHWLHSNDDRALLVTGARQVGKTWLICDYANKSGMEVLYYNFDENASLDAIFQNSKNPENILSELEILRGKRIVPETSILIFDEIQKSEAAISSLKYFCESKISYHIIGAGSLLGVKLARFSASFPVGKVKLANLYPMDFEEFLIAAGEELLLEKIKSACQAMRTLSEPLHKKALQLYRDYLYVGGMPQAVLSYISSKQHIAEFDREVLSSIQRSYLADMSKYTKSGAETLKIEEIYQSLPRQLARENHKFKYADVKKGASKRDYHLPLLWLISASMVYPAYKAGFCESPLETYKDENNFRIYLSDVGLLGAMANVPLRVIFSNEENIFRGILTENYVAQQLAASGLGLYYYKPNQNMEIDFLLDLPEGVIPLEVKAGQHKVSRSLKRYMEEKRPPYAIRLSTHNFGKKDGLYSIPLYAACCIGKELSTAIHAHAHPQLSPSQLTRAMLP